MVSIVLQMTVTALIAPGAPFPIPTSHIAAVYYVTINGQITGKLDPLARTKKVITPTILQLTLSLNCLFFTKV